MLPLDAKIFTKELTNSSIVIVENMGVKAVSVYCSTTTTGTILGTAPLGALTSSSITIAKGETVNVGGMGSDIVKDLTITAAASCTLKVIAYV